MIDPHRLTSVFLDLVRIDSPSLGEKGVADHLKARLSGRGYDIRIDDANLSTGGDTGNVIVRVPATGPGDPMAFSAHMDCVPPCLGVTPVLDNGILRSSGNTVLGGDDKAGISAILEALFHLEEERIPHPDLYLLFTVCEEAGMFGAKGLDFSRILAREVVVLDACGDVGTIIVRAPAKAGLKVAFHGRAAHAGIEPEKGISAIQMAAAAISRMRLLRIDEETVANLGRIEGGGPTNIVPDSATLTGEARSQSETTLMNQIGHMRGCCMDAAREFGGSCDFSFDISYPAMHVPQESALLGRALHACERLGLVAAVKGTGGGSDANIFSGHGLSCINLGIGMSRVHTTDEFIRVADLIKTARLTAELMQS
ncbi:MAG: M20/M25/M40 family metallo-hydrolase [Desulfovibrionales bacterium]|nr:M20/M25/M40 family metallo-hydrolase [Desulfovibrionales bacterium]